MLSGVSCAYALMRSTIHPYDTGLVRSVCPTEDNTGSTIIIEIGIGCHECFTDFASISRNSKPSHVLHSPERSRGLRRLVPYSTYRRGDEQTEPDN